MGEWRRLVWSQAKGKILEVVVGTGKNFINYPPGADVTAIDFSENMLSRARARAEQLGIRATILQMDVQALKFEDESFDTIVSTCVFCSFPDPVKGLIELRRVCKKGKK